jgi:hypothetical protein
MTEEISVFDFREYVERSSDSDLQDFLDEIQYLLLDLEQDDFFGTEGINKRFA